MENKNVSDRIATFYRPKQGWLTRAGWYAYLYAPHSLDPSVELGPFPNQYAAEAARQRAIR